MISCDIQDEYLLIFVFLGQKAKKIKHILPHFPKRFKTHSNYAG
jgi:hypothetical protein